MNKIKVPWALVIIDAVLWLITLFGNVLGKIPVLGVIFKFLAVISKFLSVALLVIIIVMIALPVIKKVIAKIKSRKAVNSSGVNMSVGNNTPQIVDDHGVVHSGGYSTSNSVRDVNSFGDRV